VVRASLRTLDTKTTTPFVFLGLTGWYLIQGVTDSAAIEFGVVVPALITEWLRRSRKYSSRCKSSHSRSHAIVRSAVQAVPNPTITAAYCVGSTVRSLAIQPSVLPDSMKTVRPGHVSQTDTVGVSGGDGLPSSSVPDCVPVAIEVV